MANTYSKYNLSNSTGSYLFNMIDNYVYFYHIDKYILIPTFPESISDNTSVSFQTSTPLSRSAPIYSYASSGPRSVTFDFALHRDLMQDINYNKSNYNIGDELNNDYVDVIIRLLQTSALPAYEAASKTVKPPIIAVRLGDQIFIKGVVDSVNTTYSGPILYDKDATSGIESGNGKYAEVKINFTVKEIDPFSADMVMEKGSFRCVGNSLEDKIYVQKSQEQGTRNLNSIDPVFA